MKMLKETEELIDVIFQRPDILLGSKTTHLIGVGVVEPDAPVNEAPLHVFVKSRSSINFIPS